MKKECRVFFFGDSICFGQGISLHKGWVARISSCLEGLSEELGKQVTVINASINGNTTRMALERMPYDIQSQHPDILIVQFGMNDCNIWETDKGLPRVSPDSFSANLVEITQRAFNFGVKKIFIHTNHPSTRDEKPMAHSAITYQQHNAHYNEYIRRTVAQLNDPRIILNDMEETILEKTGGDIAPLLLPDAIHLSVEGHNLYFESVYPLLKEAVVELVQAPVVT